ncbi:hypothetical protein CSA56_18625 [candidate division KSB3 bacterium]|uniref:Sugar ABC transporter substrate-binding protein n=1 Tax=candidate division KSB3 bacterium TaxID=2044937 RepID=A0A2G6K7D4_9BACT|nr:MAG: hypothetical protein CSA56_18625 [candidate division KSB3 bacterium]
MKKLFGLLCIAALLFAFSIGACAKETIIYYLWDDPTYKNIVEEFNASQDEIFVDAKFIPAKDYESKLMTLLAGGAEMDAYMNKSQVDIFPMVDNGYAEPLDELIEKYGFDIEAIGGYKGAIVVDDEVYAIPFRGEAFFTYYNKKVFERAGIPTPETYVEKGEWTWEKFAEVSNQLATGDGEVYGAIMYIWPICQVMPADQRGLKYITADGELDVDDSLAFAFKLRKELEATKAIIPLAELKATKTHYSKAFYAGNAGMLLIGAWFPGMMIKGRDEDLLKDFTWNDWGLTRLPCNEAEYSTTGIPTSNHIHPDSDKKDAAFKFISWMGGPEGAAVVAKNGFMPAMFGPKAVEAIATALPDESSLKYFTESIARQTSWFNKYGPKISTEITNLMEEYLLNDMTDTAFMDEVKKRFEEIVKTTM